MKKTIAIAVAALMILSGTVAFAESKGQNEPASGTPVKMQEAKMLAERLGPQIGEVKENKEEMLRVREEIRTAYGEAQSAIGEMIQNRDQLRLDQIEALEDCLNRIRESRGVLEGTIGEIEGEMTKFRSQARNRNQEGASESLENCAKVQTVRIQEMKRVLEELNKINDM